MLLSLTNTHAAGFTRVVKTKQFLTQFTVLIHAACGLCVLLINKLAAFLFRLSETVLKVY